MSDSGLDNQGVLDREQDCADQRSGSVESPARSSQGMRVGAVNYLNSKPLIEGLGDSLTRGDLVLDYPSRLVDELADGLLDVALIPSVEVFRDPDYEIISDACVATHGPVLSVKLYSRVPMGDVRRVALDEGSRTSAALALIMLSERYGVEPVIEPLPLGSTVESTEADAVLLIGDRAIHALDESFVTTWDLGEEWLSWTGLPFVFAMWAGLPNPDMDELDRLLCEARDRGVADLKGIAQREAPILGIGEDTAYDYLTKNLHFQLGSAERRGLILFHELAVKLGLAPEGVDLVFRHCTTA